MPNFDYESLIVDIPDYPEPGVIFKDVTPLVSDPQGFARLVDDIAAHFVGKGITKVVGAEARGFLVGAPVAYRLGAGFVPARKPGKLPRAVFSEKYALEYGTDELQIHQDAISPTSSSSATTSWPPQAPQSRPPSSWSRAAPRSSVSRSSWSSAS